MKILLDTHIVCWQFYEPKRIPEAGRRLMIEAEAVYVSSASIWEIAIKARLGKIDVNPRWILDNIENSGLLSLPVLHRHAVLVADLPLLHTDPFDRLLIAQATCEPLHLLTVDGELGQYSNLVVQV
jgi:PIN domain nuclease of toxin-antitoxin system